LIDIVRRYEVNKGRYIYFVSCEVKKAIKGLLPADFLIFRIELNNAWAERKKLEKIIRFKNRKVKL